MKTSVMQIKKTRSKKRVQKMSSLVKLFCQPRISKTITLDGNTFVPQVASQGGSEGSPPPPGRKDGRPPYCLACGIRIATRRCAICVQLDGNTTRPQFCDDCVAFVFICPKGHHMRGDI